MNVIKPLAAADLIHRCDPDGFGLVTTLLARRPTEVFILTEAGAMPDAANRLAPLRALEIPVYLLALAPGPRRLAEQLLALRLQPQWCLLPPTLDSEVYETLAVALACPLLIVGLDD